MNKLIKKWLNKEVKEVSWDKNTYTPKIKKTVYPNHSKGNDGEPIYGHNKQEWYGLRG